LTNPLPRPVWLLGWVSLATDAASEAIYPLMPFFLTQVLGASAVSLGLVEGAAEATNSVLKILSGRIADRAPSKRPIVAVGYALSSAVRPLIALAQSWQHVFTIRMVDRVGKGIRGAPRDAMLAGLAQPSARGAVFGFHRAMDHAGAVVGPVLATLFLWAYPGRYRALFAWTIVPGVLAVLLIFFVKEERSSPVDRSPTGQASSPVPRTPTLGRMAGRLPPAYTRFMIVLTLFTLGNSSDAFLLLKLTEAAGGAEFMPLLWAALHVVKASASALGGRWSDRVGRRAAIGAGWLIYAAVYLGFAVVSSFPALVVWFLLYGLYFGLTEGTERALVADLAPAPQRGLAFGVYQAVQGIGALAASILFGLVWTTFGAAAAFGLGASLAFIATALLFTTMPRHVRYT
jgi:MFS family permease